MSSKITISKLKLRNFMKFAELDVDFHGHDASIIGKNEEGKTSIASAWSWLLFDKDIQGNASGNFSLKTLDPKTERPIPKLDHSVEAEIKINDVDHCLKKVYKEKWKEDVLVSHTTDYYIDGLPIIKKEYDAFVEAEIIPSVVSLLVSSTGYFFNLPWQKQRALLFGLCDEVSEEILKEAEKRKKILAAEKKAVSKELEGIQPRIDEKKREIQDIPVNLNLKSLNTKKKKISKKLAVLKSQSEETRLSQELEKIKFKIQKLEAAEERRINAACSDIDREITDLENQISSLNRDINYSKSEIERKREDNKYLTNQLDKIKGKIESLQKTSVSVADFIDQNCPTCGQKLPKDKIADAIADARRQISEKLEQLSIEIKEKEKRRKEGKKVIEQLKIAIQGKETKIVQINNKIEVLQKEKAKVEKTSPAVAKKISALKEKAKDLRKQIQAGKSRENAQEIKRLENELSNIYSLIAQKKQADTAQERINELLAKEKKLINHLEKLKRDLAETEQKIQDQARELEDKINSYFQVGRFQLFVQLMNGEIKPTCIFRVGGVQYGHGLNTGSEIRAELDIIRAFQEKYGVYVPVFVDRAESLTKRKGLKMPCQMIWLEAKKGKKLNIPLVQ